MGRSLCSRRNRIHCAGLGKLFEELGGTLMLQTEVSEIVIENGRATGVRLENGDIYRTDAVVSNADVAFTYKNMISKKNRPRKVDLYFDNLQYSNSLVVIYFGTKRRYLTASCLITTSFWATVTGAC